jgi:hypothetical protein
MMEFSGILKELEEWNASCQQTDLLDDFKGVIDS